MATFIDGYLERIVAIKVVTQDPFHPWYSFAPIQQPMSLSRLHASEGPDTGVWALRPFLSEISGGNAFGPPANIPWPKIGFASLEDAIDNGQPAGDYSPIQFMAKPAKNISGDTPLDTPNIWQITGLTQPRNKHGQIVQPSGAFAAHVARTAEADWNATSEAFNAQWAAINGVHDAFSISYPTSSFAVPIGNPSDPKTRFAFCGGLPAAFWFVGGRSAIFAAVWASNIKVAQLDQAVWDTDTFPPVRR